MSEEKNGSSGGDGQAEPYAVAAANHEALPAAAEAVSLWRPIETAPRDGTLFLACNLDHPAWGSWPMCRRVRHRVGRDGEWSMEDLGGWNHIRNVEKDLHDGHETGPDPDFSIAADEYNTSVRYGWMPLPTPTTQEADHAE